MIVEVRRGDILESTAQTLTNTVNTVGVMGRGIALAFKKQFPEMHKDYVARCDEGEVQLGRPYLWKELVGPWVLNFPTKDHWRSVSKLSDIVAGLEHLAERVDDWGIESLAVPPLGCGLGQLDWTVVGPTLYRHLDSLRIPVELYAPWETPDGQLDLDWLAREPIVEAEPRAPVQAAWVALADIAARINEQPHAWPIGKTRFQKLAYFATVAGVETELDFVEGSYGPFSDGMARVLSRLVNNGLISMHPFGRMVLVDAGPTLADARSMHSAYLETNEPAIERTIDLLSRLSGPQTEAASTVLFVSRALRERTGKRPTEIEVLAEAQRWKARRKPAIPPITFAESIRSMRSLGWLDASQSSDLPIDEDLLTLA